MSARYRSDEDLARDFLAGVAEDDGKVFSNRYLKKGGKEEKVAKEALARLLRGDSPLTHFVRFRLAALFDPQSTDERQFLIANKRRGKQAKPAIELEIARDIAVVFAKNGKMEAAYEAAKARYAVSLRTAHRAWEKNKDCAFIRSLIEANRLAE